jgi:hypothetical protein
VELQHKKESELVHKQPPSVGAPKNCIILGKTALWENSFLRGNIAELHRILGKEL